MKKLLLIFILIFSCALSQKYDPYTGELIEYDPNTGEVISTSDSSKILSIPKSTTMREQVIKIQIPVSNQDLSLKAETELIACQQGIQDAKEDNQKVLSSGSILFDNGLLGIFNYRTKIDGVRLIGKSEDYIRLYSDCYDKETHKIQRNRTIFILFIGFGFYVSAALGI